MTLGALALEPNVVLPLLSNRLNHAERYMRLETVGVLESFAKKDPMAVPTLAVGLRDPDASVRAATTNALLRIAPKAITNAAPE